MSKVKTERLRGRIWGFLLLQRAQPKEIRIEKWIGIYIPESRDLILPICFFLCNYTLGRSWKRRGVLVLAGIELIFFIVACMGLFWICAGNSVDNTGMF